MTFANRPLLGYTNLRRIDPSILTSIPKPKTMNATSNPEPIGRANNNTITKIGIYYLQKLGSYIIGFAMCFH